MNLASIIKLKTKLNTMWQNGDISESLILGDIIILNYRSNSLMNTKKYADDIFDIAYINDEAGNYEKADMLYRESAGIIQKLCGKDLNYTYRISNMAIIYTKTARLPEALKLLREAYKLRQTLLGHSHYLTIETLYNLGNAYYDDENYEKALFCLLKSRGMRRRKDADYVDNVNSIAYVYEEMGQYDKAVNWLEIGLNITKNSNSSLSPEYLKSLYYIGNLYNSIGQFDRAREFLEKFLEISEKTMGEKNPYNITVLNLISKVYAHMMNEDKALHYMLKTIDMSTKTIGKKHMFFADCLSGAAMIYKNRKEYKKALLYSREALEIRRELIGEENMGYVKELILLSSIYYEDGQFEKSLEVISRITGVIEEDNNLFDECLAEMAKIFLESEDEDEAALERKKEQFMELYNLISYEDITNNILWDFLDDFDI